MTQLSKHWRWYLWAVALFGLAAIACLLWQLPFPASLLMAGLATTLGGVRIKVEQLKQRIEALEKWRDTELAIEQDLAERERRGAANVTH